MLPLKRILYPTDFSLCAEGGLVYALELAARFGAALHVLHVVEGEARPAAPADLMRPAEANLDIRLRETVNARLGKFDIATRENLHVAYILARDEAPAPAILRYADAHDMDLIVMGTHGRRGLRRLLLGSVATEVLHESLCDVLTIRANKEPAFAPPRGRQILVPLDLSGSSTGLLRQATTIAEFLQARLTLLHVIEPAPLPVFTVGQEGPFGTLIPNLRQAARARLERLREEVDLPAHTDIWVDEGPPSLLIPDIAEEQQVDLIVMAARSRQGAKRLLLGSVTERVVRRTACPVWIMKTPDPEYPRGLEPRVAGKPEMVI